MAKEKTSSRELSRPPVVVVLGHVDHGKTTLLDKIRQTNVVAKEFGGITQHIGAYQVSFTPRPTAQEPKPSPKMITFIDTPGHAAFSEMRSRGAKVADLAILVIAADEGVKPQTLESLKYISQTKIPYLVAINKIDLPNINLEKVKKSLVKDGILIEGYGGNVVSLPISAKTGKGIDELLEMLILLAEMQELRGDVQVELEAVVIESKIDSRRGPLATILVRNGSLKIGDQIETEGTFAKIKAMFNENGQPVRLAGPSKPVEVLGFKSAPQIGSQVKRTTKVFVAPFEKPKPELVKKKESKERKLSLIVKTDVAGTLEAILAGLPKDIQVIDSGVGEVNESNVLLAQTTGAEIVAFNVKAPVRVKKLAETEKVKISFYQVIYKLFEEIEEKIRKFCQPSAGEEIVGKAEILKEFKIDKEKIAGCRVIEGEIKKAERLHLMRQDKLIGDCRIKSMKTGKLDIEQAKTGEEFGAILSPRLDFNLGDMLVCFRKVEE